MPSDIGAAAGDDAAATASADATYMIHKQQTPLAENGVNTLIIIIIIMIESKR